MLCSDCEFLLPFFDSPKSVFDSPGVVFRLSVQVSARMPGSQQHPREFQGHPDSSSPRTIRSSNLEDSVGVLPGDTLKSFLLPSPPAVRPNMPKTSRETHSPKKPTKFQRMRPYFRVRQSLWYWTNYNSSWIIFVEGVMGQVFKGRTSPTAKTASLAVRSAFRTI